MSDYVQVLVLYIAFLPIFYMIAACALGYRAAHIKPSDAAIKQFLAELRFPGSLYRPYATGSGKTTTEFIKEASSIGNMIGIAGFSIVPIIFILAVLGILSEGGNPFVALFWIVLEFTSYVLALRFGVKLKRIEQSIGNGQK